MVLIHLFLDRNHCPTKKSMIVSSNSIIAKNPRKVWDDCSREVRELLIFEAAPVWGSGGGAGAADSPRRPLTIIGVTI